MVHQGVVGSVNAHHARRASDTGKLEDTAGVQRMEHSGSVKRPSVDRRQEINQKAQDVSKSIKWAHRALWIDLCIYVVFLLSFLLAALVPFVSIAWDGHMFISIFTKYASRLEWPDPSNTFEDIHSVADFWSWWKGPMRAVLLGLNPFSLAEDDFRPDHVPGHILSNVVVGTVRLRQQRVRLECQEENALRLSQAEILCYHPDLRAFTETTDWAWPRFLATEGNNSFFAPVLDEEDQQMDAETAEADQTPFVPFAGAGTVQGPPLDSTAPPTMPSSDTDTSPTEQESPGDEGTAASAPAGDTPTNDTGVTGTDLSTGEVFTTAAGAPGAAPGTDAATPPTAAVTAPVVPVVDPDALIPAGAPATAADPAEVTAPPAAAPAAVPPVDPDDATPPLPTATAPVAATEPVDPVEPPAGAVEEPVDAEADPDTAAAGAAPADSPAAADAADAAGAEDAAARRRLLTPRLLTQQRAHKFPQRGALQQIPPGTRLSMTALRQLLQDQAVEATSGTAMGDINSDEDKAAAAKATPTTTADGCPIANKQWRFGGSVPNRTCEVINNEKRWIEELTPAFTYRNNQNLSASRYMSKTSSRLFDGSGYAHDFDVKDLASFDNITQLLQDFAWIDAGTRLIMLELSLYSPATDLVTSAFFMVEVQGSGYAQSRVGYEAFRLHYYKTNALKWGRLVVELMFVILTVASFASDLSPVIFRRNAFVKQDQHWSRNPFFWMSVIMMGTTMAAIGLRIHNVVELSTFNPAEVAPGSDAFGSHFAQLQGPAARVRVERSLMALLSFCVWLRVFKYTRRVPVFGTIGRTMTRAFPAIVVFIAMSTVVFVGFAQSFFLGFYVSNEGFQTLQEALVSMVRFTSGDVDYDALKRTNTVLAPTLYCLALFVLGFVWTSLLLAIVINAYYDEEDAFEFDKEFKDFRVDNPLLRQHKEWDNDAMTGENGSMLLTPQFYNRFVVNTLSKFDTNEPMISMTMAEFLQAARSNTNDWEQGETQPIRRGSSQPPRSNHINLPTDEERPTFVPGGEEDEQAQPPAVVQPAIPSDRIETDSSFIIVRFGSLKGPRKARDAHALYFPIDMDEHRCRAWWKMHKHHLRVGDAVVRYIQRVPQNLRPQQIVLVNTAKAPITGAGALLRSNTRNSRNSSQGTNDGQPALGHRNSSFGGSMRNATPLNGRHNLSRNVSRNDGGSTANSPAESVPDLDTSSANGGIMSRVLGLRGLRRSTTMNSATTDKSTDEAPYDLERRHTSDGDQLDTFGGSKKTKGGMRTYVRSSSRQSDGRHSAVHTASSNVSPTADPYSTAGSIAGGLPPSMEHDVMQPLEDASAVAPYPKPPRHVRKPDNVSSAPAMPPAAPSVAPQYAAHTSVPQFVPGQQTGAPLPGNKLSVDLMSGPIHGGVMSAIPEVTEPLTGQLTGQFTGGLDVTGLHHRASSSSAMYRASSADVMSPMGPPPADNDPISPLHPS